MSKEEEAKSRFNAGYNCSQSVFSVFSDELDLNDEQALKLSSAFGGGINNLGKTCGAITGALMAIGMKYGKTSAVDPEKQLQVSHLSKEVIRKFRKKNHSIECSELLGLNPANRHSEVNANLYMNCPKYVSDMVKILEKILADDVDE